MPTYTGIKSEAFRHPLDKEAEKALRNLPGFDVVARKFVEFVYEKPQFVFLMGNSIQVGPRQYPTIYHIFRECVRDLDIYPQPALFVAQNPLVNAQAIGQEQPCVILNSALLDLLDESEIRSVLAHELGHIKCGHTTLIQMARWLMEAAFFIGDLTFGIGNIFNRGLILAFYEWLRKAELSADRAALLVMDDVNPVMHSMMKMAGGSVRYAKECSLDEFKSQAQKYQELDEDSLNQIYKFLLYNNISQGVFTTHPFTVERIRHLQEWANSEEYRQIRQGNYQQTTTQAVNVTSEASPTDVEILKRQIEKLQQEINQIKSQSLDE
ncbi:MAG TPA: M48 family metallopeptidase [Oculatellaceae cyanobacterium]|jgi:Zn-dependent protease with chaperone function